MWQIERRPGRHDDYPRGIKIRMRGGALPDEILDTDTRVLAPPIRGDEKAAMTRPRDLSWEALVEVTGANVSVERGAVNFALASIRSEMTDVPDETLAEEIRFRARSYRKAWPNAALTPTALSKHWSRIVAEAAEVKPTPAAPVEGWSMCALCGNGAWVFIAGTDDAAPCPLCNKGRKAEVSAYGREGGFWDSRNWIYGSAPQEVVLT